MTFSISTTGSLILGLLLVASKVLHTIWGQGNRRRLPLPPGPPPKFLVGNALDFPKTDAGRTFSQWGRDVNSDIVYAKALATDVVILNKRKMAEDLFETKAAIYNNRPHLPILKFLGWEFNMALLPYGELWRQHRKICQQNFSHDGALRYRPIQTERVNDFLQNLLQTPEKFEEHGKLLSMSIAVQTMYGYKPESLHDPVIHVAEQSVELGAVLMFGGTLMSVIPILGYIPTWFPGAVSQKMAAKVRELTAEMKRIPMEHVKKAFKNGTVSPSLVTDYFERKNTIGAPADEEEVVKNIAWTVYGAASDTTISGTGSFLYLIAKNPEVQIRAQAELDRVVGRDRLPDFSDRESMPYLEAIYREVFRYSPPMYVGVPHSLMEDDVYEGYFLPKNTMLFANIWAMTHDETVYPEPFAFKPERFLNEDGTLNDDSRILAYGFGRRICIGKAVASNTMWLMMASVLACFDIRKSKDEFGNEIEIADDYDDFGTIIRKKPFKCTITPRSSNVHKLVDFATSCAST